VVGAEPPQAAPPSPPRAPAPKRRKCYHRNARQPVDEVETGVMFYADDDVGEDEVAAVVDAPMEPPVVDPAYEFDDLIGEDLVPATPRQFHSGFTPPPSPSRKRKCSEGTPPPGKRLKYESAHGFMHTHRDGRQMDIISSPMDQFGPRHNRICTFRWVEDVWLSRQRRRDIAALRPRPPRPPVGP
jgi:hypothetical protein